VGGAHEKSLSGSAFSSVCIRDNVDLWDLSNGQLTRKGGVDVGERLALLGQKTRAVISQKARELVFVRSASGQEGWIRSDSIAPNSILAVVVVDSIIVYSQPRLSAPTDRTLPFMTLLAISRPTAASLFVSVSCWDEETGTSFSGAFIRNTGISSWIGNVESVILYRIASRTESKAKRTALLSSALADYPGSAFVEVIQEAIQAPAPPKG
jgi:hypothetical protein